MSSVDFTQSNPLHLRIFLASPSDVVDERRLALAVLDELQYDPFLRGNISIEIVAWDGPGCGIPMTATMSPQAAIERGLTKPSQCDIVIVIFWSRMGTLLPISWVKPEKYRYLSGTPWEDLNCRYISGTEWEFFDALAKAEESEKPEILVYRRSKKRLFDPDEQDYENNGKQWNLVKEFFNSFRSDDGSIRRGYNTYLEPHEFKKQLEDHIRLVIRELLDQRFQKSTRCENDMRLLITPPPFWDGSPFPGLKAFAPYDAPIYFGREPETDDLLRKIANPGIRFIAVVGASGSGKSSFIAAGVIPRLLAGAIETSQEWKWVKFTPGELSYDPCLALLKKLSFALNVSEDQVMGVINDIQSKLLGLELTKPFGIALAPKLLLFIDQLEELFTVVSPGEQGAFIDLINTITQLPQVTIVTTLRSDFLEQCLKYSVLAKLLQSEFFILAEPGLNALHDMITRPAERAGLIFENGLVDKLLSEMKNSPGALPLLAFALAELYQARQGNRLTWISYEGFQGVYGAIAQRAESTFNGLSQTARNSLGWVFQSLITVDEQGLVTRQLVSRGDIANSESANELLDAFIKARLLIATSGEGRQPVIKIAHEALLTSWPLLVQWIKNSQEDLKVLRRLRLDAAEWEQKGRAEEYLWSARRRHAAQLMLGRLKSNITPTERLFLTTEGEVSELTDRELEDFVIKNAELYGVSRLLRTRVPSTPEEMQFDLYQGRIRFC